MYKNMHSHHSLADCCSLSRSARKRWGNTLITHAHAQRHTRKHTHTHKHTHKHKRTYKHDAHTHTLGCQFYSNCQKQLHT